MLVTIITKRVRRIIDRLNVIADERQTLMDRLWLLEHEARDLRVKLNRELKPAAKKPRKKPEPKA